MLLEAEIGAFAMTCTIAPFPQDIAANRLGQERYLMIEMTTCKSFKCLGWFLLAHSTSKFLQVLLFCAEFIESKIIIKNIFNSIFARLLDILARL